MELQQIKYFKVIAETENISKAAERLFVAQPSLSQMLKRLESELGTPLFDRNGKQIVLNTAGRIFLKYCDEILLSIENAKRELNDLTQNKTVNVSISVESASLLLPEIIQQLQTCVPKVMPQIFQSGSSDWDLKLHSGFTPLHSHSSILLLEEPIGVVIPIGHPLADKESITKQDLNDSTFLSLSPACNLYNIISYYCENNNFMPTVSMYVDSPSILRDLLKMNLGLAFVPQYTWHSFYDTTLKYRTITDLPMLRYVWLTTNEKHYVSTAVRHCCDTIIDYFTTYNQQFQ